MRDADRAEVLWAAAAQTNDTTPSKRRVDRRQQLPKPRYDAEEEQRRRRLLPRNVSVPQGHIDLLGECRDVTTTKAQAETPMSVSRTSQPEDPIKYALTAHEEVVGVADGIAGSLIGQTLVVALSLVIFGVAGA